VTWLIYMWHDSFRRDMTHSYVTWRIHMWHDTAICDMTHPWLIHTWHDTVICDKPDSCVTVKWSIHMWHFSFMCDMTHLRVAWRNNMWHDASIRQKTLQGGEDPEDALYCKWSSAKEPLSTAKEPLSTGLFCAKWTIRIRHPMGLRHPLSYLT